MAAEEKDLYDITFIGAGPVALYGMYYAGLRLMKSKVIDMLGEVGGGLTALYPEKYIYDMAGFPKILAKDLVKVMHEQACEYPQTFCMEEEVMHLKHSENGVIKITSNKGEHWTKTLVICAGLGAYTPRKVNVPKLEKYEGNGVYYFVNPVEKFKDKNVLIVGGGDSAFDYCMMLEPVAKSITHIHRNSMFTAHEDTIKKVKSSSVTMKFPFWEIQEIHGNGKVEKVTLHQTKSDEKEILDIEAIVLSIGFITDLGPITDWGLELDKHCIVVDSRMRTNLEGVFAAGDITAYDGKLKLISLGCGEVSIAVNNAKHDIDPKAKVGPGHSTDKHILALRKIARQKEKGDQVSKS